MQTSDTVSHCAQQLTKEATIALEQWITDVLPPDQKRKKQKEISKHAR